MKTAKLSKNFPRPETTLIARPAQRLAAGPDGAYNSLVSALHPKNLALALAALVLALGLTSCDSGRRGRATKGGCVIAGQLEKKGLVLVPLSAWTKKRLGDGFGPMDLLERPCLDQTVAPKVEIDDRTEFYVFFSPLEAKAGDQVVFTWYYGHPERVLARPLVKVLVKRDGFDRPLAISQIWSAPHGSSKLLSMGGLNSVQSKAQWEASRIYGPRTLVVSRFAGFDHNRARAGETLAEVHFEIHEKGVQVY